MKKTFTETYASCDREFLQLAREATPKWKDGCTATTILALDNVLYAANVGVSFKWKKDLLSNLTLAFFIG